jgi:hypothetical protein
VRPDGHCVSGVLRGVGQNGPGSLRDVGPRRSGACTFLVDILVQKLEPYVKFSVG